MPSPDRLPLCLATKHASRSLVNVLDADLKLEHERLASQFAQHENAYTAAQSPHRRANAYGPVDYRP